RDQFVRDRELKIIALLETVANRRGPANATDALRRQEGYQSGTEDGFKVVVGWHAAHRADLESILRVFPVHRSNDAGAHGRAVSFRCSITAIAPCEDTSALTRTRLAILPSTFHASIPWCTVRT